MSYTPPLGSAVDFQYDTGGYTPPVGGLLFDYSQDGVYRATGYGHLSPLGGGALGSTPESDTYIPPLGYRVHFQYDSEPYEAPLGSLVIFGHDYPYGDGLGSVAFGGSAIGASGASIVGAGKIMLTGAAQVSHGAGVSGGGFFAFSGTSSVTHRTPVLADGSGGIYPFTGAGSVTHILPTWCSGAGSITFSASGAVAHGVSAGAQGAISLGGSASGMTGKAARGSSALRFAGRGYMRRGNSGTGSGAVALSGVCAVSALPVFSSSATGGLRFGGFAVGFHPVAQRVPSDTVFVRTTRMESVYVG